MKTRKVSVIIFYDDKKRILLQDRRGINKLGEAWGFFGGKIEEGESPEQAVVRETKEELNFDLKNYKYVGEYTYGVDESLRKKFNFDFENILCSVFVAPLKNNLSKFRLKEGRRMKLFSLSEAEKLKMVSKEDTEMIRKLNKIL